MLKPKPIIEIEVRIHAISVLSDAITVRRMPRSVRSSARIVPLSFGASSTGLMCPLLKYAPYDGAGIRLQTSRTQRRRAWYEPPVTFGRRSRGSARASGGSGERDDRRPVLPDSKHAEDESSQHRDQRDRKE